MDTATPLRHIHKPRTAHRGLSWNVFKGKAWIQDSLFRRRLGMTEAELEEAIQDGLLDAHYYRARERFFRATAVRL
jgi:hypothetical protein